MAKPTRHQVGPAYYSLRLGDERLYSPRNSGAAESATCVDMFGKEYNVFYTDLVSTPPPPKLCRSLGGLAMLGRMCVLYQDNVGLPRDLILSDVHVSETDFQLLKSYENMLIDLHIADKPFDQIMFELIMAWKEAGRAIVFNRRPELSLKENA